MCPSSTPSIWHLGYGAVDRPAMKLATEILLGKTEPPDRSDTDDFFKYDRQVRETTYGVFSRPSQEILQVRDSGPAKPYSRMQQAKEGEMKRGYGSLALAIVVALVLASSPAVGGKKEKRFQDEGMVVGNSSVVNFTYELMQRQCVFPPPTQGLDAWVSELPKTFGDGKHYIDVTATPMVADPRPDVDLYFLTSDCQPAGLIATGDPEEMGFIPPGSRFVVSQIFTTALENVTVEAWLP